MCGYTHIRRFFYLALILFAGLSASAQNTRDEIEIDYSRPQQYILGGVGVEGNNHVNENQLISLTGLHPGMKLTIPGDDVSSIVKRLWAQRYFEDVAVVVDRISAARDTAWLKIVVKERPRVSRWTYTGVKSGEKKDLQERLNLRPGREFSEYVRTTSEDIIKRYYKEKGYQLVDVETQVKKDSVIRSAIRVNFDVRRGKKIRVKRINFIGKNDDVSDYKLSKSMKETHSARWYNFFKSKKFKEKEYQTDRKTVLEAFNEAGYRDARLVRDSLYYVDDKHMDIDMVFDQGRKYYFRNVTWTGNSVYPSEVLDNILQIKKGDIYDVVTMEKRLHGGGKQNEYDVSKLYRDNGYLFFNVTPVEVNIQNDSVDVEMRISEGKPARLNNIVINGNDLTNERVVRRQVMTRPGYLFSQSEFERSIREIASLGQFDAEAIMGPGGYSIIPNQLNNTVDIIYNVTEKPSSQLELSGGWGGNTFVATAGVSFNNFSTRRLLDKKAWRPVPLGDAQSLAFRFQTNGRYYTNLSASFMEPWLFGKKPTSLSISGYYSRMTDAYYNSSYWLTGLLTSSKMFEVFGFTAGLGNRLKWPDNYFVLYNNLSWQTYRLTNWTNSYFAFNDGVSHNLSYTISLTRNSTDQQIYPRQGSEFSASLQFTPPYSLLRKYTWNNSDANNPVREKVASWKDINYDNWTSAQRYKWIEYHKWKFGASIYTKLVGDLVLMTKAQFGYLGYYNRKWGYSPFENFQVGGDGMSGYMTYGAEIVSLRGYEDYSLTPQKRTPYSQSGISYAGNVYDKFTVELRYPVILQPQSTIFVLAFLEGGNCWSDIKEFNPFQIKRSAGVGVRIFLPMIGLLGVDWGYGFDDSVNGGSQFHFVLGQQF
ncbi:MAG: outer membrane protein assembly factor BamA [Bacteroidales bacterium]|nr:outer membrane protein assembly factor BamA [Bacteroidales bacterium]